MNNSVTTAYRFELHFNTTSLDGLKPRNIDEHQASSTNSPRILSNSNSTWSGGIRWWLDDGLKGVYKILAEESSLELKQAPRAWYDLSSSFLLSQKFSKGVVDPTLFVRKEGKDILQGKIYVDDIILASTDPALYQDNPNHVYKLKKALYELKQAPRAWYDLSSSFLLSQKFSKGAVDPTLFVRKEGKDILLIIKKYGMETSDSMDTLVVEKSKLNADSQWNEVDPTRYREMIGSLMYLKSSRPDLVFAVWHGVRKYKSRAKALHKEITSFIKRSEVGMRQML
ncbi:retrovirus-related pol polyprotein from transposon TNT 1-94 [Tanacetum coccineum]